MPQSPLLCGKKHNLTPFAIIIVLSFLYYSYRNSFQDATTQHLFSSKTSKAKNVAVIIEDRPLPNLIPLILHFSNVLGPAWPIILYTSQISHPNSTAFQRAIKDGRVLIRDLPSDVQFQDHASVSEFLTLPWFWEQLAPAQHVLMFQADSIICANSERKIEDFLEYDFVGAPIEVPKHGNNGHGEGYNGGFSLRNRSMILDIIRKSSWKKEKETGIISQEGCVTKAPCLKFEDQWFYHKMKEIEGANLPSIEAAPQFAVETIWYDSPLGFHQVERWNAGKMAEVAAYCPEYAMATTDLLVKHTG